jgi:hypothetical protein
VANNHSEDYGKQGYDDTVGLLKEHGVAYGEHRKTTIFEVDGLKIGVYSVAGAYNTNGLAENIKSLKKAGADVIIACMHWGEEYYYVPNIDQVTIARAAIADPPVLILDEATSSIDTRTEKIVQDGMDSLMKGRTTFVIAHRLSTVRNSDLIVVLEQGRIIEQGTHDELIELGQKYYQLYTGGRASA